MRITITKTRDVLTPDLRERLRRAQHPKKALEAMGLAVVSLAMRAFTIASVRPATWAPLKPATIAAKKRKGYSSGILNRSGTLMKSPRIVAVTNRSVTVGSDRRAGSHSLAAIHQLGSQDGKIPARPFFPFDKSRRLTERGRKNVLAAAKAALDAELKRGGGA